MFYNYNYNNAPHDIVPGFIMHNAKTPEHQHFSRPARHAQTPINNRVPRAILQKAIPPKLNECMS